ncbi:MAG: hypothetical protein ABR592_01095 [Nitriliruptorales bacterium]
MTPQPSPHMLTFSPGEVTKTFTLSVKGDRKKEPNETFSVNMSNPTNAIIVDAQGLGTTENND